MTKITNWILTATLGAGIFLRSTHAAEDPLITQAKKVFAEQQDSVVWISVVAKISLQAEGGKEAVNIPDREQKNETLGTFIDATGLVVTALSSIDPSREYNGREVRTRDGTIKIEANVVLKEVRVTMPDGTEIPADVVMRDVDLDLAFLRIKSGAKEAKGLSFKPVDLKNAASVNVSDDVVTISRNDEVLNRVASVARGQIVSVTKKPREFLRATGASLGCPTFTPDGKLVGLAVNRTLRGKSSQTVIIPAADVLEIAEQARAAKPVVEEKPKKTEEPKEEK